MLRRMFIALTASTLLAAPAFADGHTKDIVIRRSAREVSPRWWLPLKPPVWWKR